MARANQVEMTEAQMDAVTRNTKELLDAMPKMKVRLFLDSETKRKIEAAKEAGKSMEIPYETVSINGYTYQIQRGETVEVPEEVYNILERGGHI